MKRKGRRRRRYGLVRYKPIGYGSVSRKRKKRRIRRMIREFLAVFACTVLAVGILFLLGTAGYYLFLRAGRPVFGEGKIRISLENGGYTVTWPPLQESEKCRLYLYDDEEDAYALYGEYETEAFLSVQPEADQAPALRLQVVRNTEILGMPHVVEGEKKDISLALESPTRPALTKSVDEELKKCSVFWTVGFGCEYEVYLRGENDVWELYAEDAPGMVQLDFAYGMKLPDREHPICLAVREGRRGNGFVLYGELSDPIYIERSELMGQEEGLSYGRIDVCQYILRWKEGKGRYYALQQWSDRAGDWVTMATYDWTDELSYETGRLPSGTQVRFRVVTYDDEAQRDSGQFVDEPMETSFRTEYSVYYCTVWPITPLDLLESAQGGSTLAKVPAGEALCVLGEENGCFRVRYKDHYGYVDSRYCLIDLPEYLGNLCAYNITNSYDSIFRVHGYEIPGITGGVVEGYEGVQLEDGTFLVPYLYPCAKKLISAAEAVREDGYYLCIYDAFRPNEATRFLYDTTELLLDFPVPKLPAEEEIQEGEETDMEGENGEQPDGEGSAAPDDGENRPEEDTQPEEGESVDLYGGLQPEVIARLGEMEPEQLAAAGLSETGAALLDGISGQTVMMLRNLSPEEIQVFQILSVDLLEVTGFFKPGEEETPEEGQEPQTAGAEAADPGTGDLETADLETMEQRTPEQIAAAYGMTPDQLVAIAVNYGLTPELLGKLSVMTLQELSSLKSLAPEELAAFLAYLQGNTQTFYQAMTDGKYRLGSFLAAQTSAHNRGIALDLTLERLDTGEGLTMQTDMHDLSWHSALPYNNENADLLAKYMKGIGFNDLTSEWWHFQDDETRNAIGLNTYLADGLEITGWKKDDRGWRYRQEDGSYFAGGALTIDGREYTFDEEGYCTEE